MDYYMQDPNCDWALWYVWTFIILGGANKNWAFKGAIKDWASWRCQV